jgi:hypothetical protein
MTTDEMAAMTLTVIPARDADLAELKRAKKEHSIDLFIDRAQEDKRASARERVQQMMTAFDKNTNGKIDVEERPALREARLRGLDPIPFVEKEADFAPLRRLPAAVARTAGMRRLRAVQARMDPAVRVDRVDQTTRRRARPTRRHRRILCCVPARRRSTAGSV